MSSTPLRAPVWAVAAVLLALTASGHAQVIVTKNTAPAGLDVFHQPLMLVQPWTSGGVGVGDFDRDGFPDIYLTIGGGERDRLFMNDGDGTFTNESSTRGILNFGATNGVAVGDYDNDGWLDIYVTSMGPGPPSNYYSPGDNRLYHNLGDGFFEEVADAAGVAFAAPVSASIQGSAVYGASFGDYDLDGDLDLFVTTWGLASSPGLTGNRLFRNDGDGTFTDVTASAIGLAVLQPVRGFQSAFADMDGDRYPEILISADFETSRYLRNNTDGTFTDITVAAGTGIDDNGMGQTVGDFDGDGRLDWYVTSIHKDFPQPGDDPGNMMYRAIGPHLYDEVSQTTNTNDGGWGWGTIALDLDDDGWLDLVEVNGREADGGGEWTNEPSKLFYNLGDGTFFEVADPCGLDHAGSGRGVAWLDVENDGDLDVLIVTNSGRFELYRNDTTPSGNWFQVEFDTSTNPRLAPDGFGTLVLATADGFEQRRYIDSSPSYLSTSQIMAHFGLGAATTVDELRLRWSSGQESVITGIAANQRLHVVAPIAQDITADGSVDVSDLVEVILSWGQSGGASDVTGDGPVDVADLIAVILAWSP